MAHKPGPLRRFVVRREVPKLGDDAELIAANNDANGFPHALDSAEGMAILTAMPAAELLRRYGYWVNDRKSGRVAVLYCRVPKDGDGGGESLRAVPGSRLRYFFDDVAYDWAGFKEGSLPPYVDGGARPLFDPRFAPLAVKYGGTAADNEPAAKPDTATTDTDVDMMFAEADNGPPPTTPPPTQQELHFSASESESDSDLGDARTESAPKPTSTSKSKPKPKPKPKAKTATKHRPKPKAKPRAKAAAKSRSKPKAPEQLATVEVDSSAVQSAHAAEFVKSSGYQKYKLWHGQSSDDDAQPSADDILKSISGMVVGVKESAALIEQAGVLRVFYG